MPLTLRKQTEPRDRSRGTRDVSRRRAPARRRDDRRPPRHYHQPRRSRDGRRPPARHRPMRERARRGHRRDPRRDRPGRMAGAPRRPPRASSALAVVDLDPVRRPMGDRRYGGKVEGAERWAALTSRDGFRCYECPDEVRIARGCNRPLRDFPAYPEPRNVASCPVLDVPAWYWRASTGFAGTSRACTSSTLTARRGRR